MEDTMNNKPTDAQVGLLWHTLGLRPDCRDSRHVYRNRFLAGPGHSDMPDLEALVAVGLMGSRKPPGFCDQSEILYFATEVGERFAIAEMPPAPPPPKRTKFDAYLMSASAMTASPTSLASTSPCSSSVATGEIESTGWFATPEEAHIGNIDAITASLSGRPTKRSKLQASGLRP